MPIEFRTIDSVKDAVEFDFPVVGPCFRLGSWNHQSVEQESEFSASPNETHFAYVAEGSGKVRFDALQFDVRAGMYLCVPGRFKLAGQCSGVLMSHDGERGIFQIGGPIEPTGRLHYIDGCSDTLLISPPRIGLPCVNHLQIPEQTLQRFHTHPSFRFGMITQGNGFCDSDTETTELMPGTVFYIPEDGLHRFRTSDDSLTVIAFHPDSDFGPDDYNHPMVNKTIVDGVSASKLSMTERQVTVPAGKDCAQE